MNNIVVRALSGSVFVALVLVPLFLSNNLYFAGVMFTFMAIGFMEYYRLFENVKTVSINWKVNSIIALIIAGIVVLTRSELAYPLFFIWILMELWRKKEQPLINIGITIFGFIYVAVPILLALRLHAMTASSFTFPLLAGMFLLIWTNDTFAFLSGKLFGKTKLFERISPKKTWEGTVGGLILTGIMAMVISQLLDKENMFFWIVSAIIIVPAAIFGDLLESLFKRSVNVKDSGNIMPGHGGILDRFDAAFFTIPFFYYWATLYFNL
jgi:phosphatidate cytidylyltransferase